MADSDLSQSEADALIAMEKIRYNDNEHIYPLPSEKLTIPLSSRDRRENFLLDITRGRIDLAKVTHQNRARKVVILMRLDLGGPSHRNPDGEEIPCPHLHFYREGYADRWASPLPASRYKNLSDLFQTLQDFMLHCNVTELPTIRQMGLF